MLAATARADAPSEAGTLNESSGGSVLRQVAGIEGLPFDEPDTHANEFLDERVAVDAIPQQPGELPSQWLGPHRVGPLGRQHGKLWQPPPWDSIWPSLRGPRTPVRLRHLGLGQPLEGTSWNNRPLSAGWFAGIVSGGQPLAGELDYELGFFGGFRAGWDYDYYWGVETRVGAAAVGIRDLPGPTWPRTGDLVVWDIDLLYYPWGDSRWRPYFSLGLGVSVFQFRDIEGERFRQALFGLPLGVGFKYRWTDFLVARFDVVNNLAFGSGKLDTTDSVSITGGIEVRFGGVRKGYWPWNPGLHLW